MEEVPTQKAGIAGPPTTMVGVGSEGAGADGMDDAALGRADGAE
jgi:hypothetical protein